MDTNILKSAAVRRSACDQCRAKRVRCLRAQNSTAPCARCAHIGVQCVTGATGQPGRPPKSRLADGVNRGTLRTPASNAATGPHMATAPGCKVNRHDFSWGWGDRLDRDSGIACSGLAGSPDSRSAAVHPHPHPHPHPLSPMDSLAHGRLHLADYRGAVPSDTNGSTFFCTPSASIEQTPTTPGHEDILSLMDQLRSPSQLQGLLSADYELDAMQVDALLDQWDGVAPPSPLPHCAVSPASSLMLFREKMDQRIIAMDNLYLHHSDPHEMMQGCKKEGAVEEPENPAAVLLTCSKDFIDIVQGLAPVDGLSTEIVLLVLSSYLSLMRLIDAMFHIIYTLVCRLPQNAFKAVKVKSVLRIGGVASLQDMPIKLYALSIIDAIQSQLRTVERCLGIPNEHCLSDSEAAAGSSPPAATAPGIFSRADRAQLFWTVMEQQDVKPRRGRKSYVGSIRANIQGSMASFEGEADR
ncbi:hypothetical protein NKR19_g461 [Coniochaeta hoffmannii]|uniref:Zn(2)-C6 fungal-type domain-containing protein n=1 Tax=Coniochaeta hoffmannii TaxID=91930 RepID=A0AA38W1R4_9PEZI|nr:hypothetical protein NKR19_g461 [Coniochaeta hoffmannii]